MKMKILIIIFLLGFNFDLLAVGIGDRKDAVFELLGRPLYELKGPSAQAEAFVFSGPNGSEILCGFSDDVLEIIQFRKPPSFKQRPGSDTQAGQSNEARFHNYPLTESGTWVSIIHFGERVFLVKTEAGIRNALVTERGELVAIDQLPLSFSATEGSDSGVFIAGPDLKVVEYVVSASTYQLLAEWELLSESQKANLSAKIFVELPTLPNEPPKEVFQN